MVGLSSLMLVRLEPVRIFGGVASLGVVVTLVLLFLLLPGAMVLTKSRRKKTADGPQQRDGLTGWLRLWMRRRLARPWPVILGFLFVSIILSVGLTRLESTVNVPRMFLPDSDIRTQYDWFETHVAPTVTGELLLSFPEMTDDDDPLRRLAVVAKSHSKLLKLDAVDGVFVGDDFRASYFRKAYFSGYSTTQCGPETGQRSQVDAWTIGIHCTRWWTGDLANQYPHATTGRR